MNKINVNEVFNEILDAIIDGRVATKNDIRIANKEAYERKINKMIQGITIGDGIDIREKKEEERERIAHDNRIKEEIRKLFKVG